MGKKFRRAEQGVSSSGQRGKFSLTKDGHLGERQKEGKLEYVGVEKNKRCVERIE